MKRRPGPLSLLVHKMESEEAQTSAGTSESPEGSEKKENKMSDRKAEDAKARDKEELGEKKRAAGKKSTAGDRDSGSSSDPDSQSDSSSKSSSSSSVRVQSRRVRQPKVSGQAKRGAFHRHKQNEQRYIICSQENSQFVDPLDYILVVWYH